MPHTPGLELGFETPSWFVVASAPPPRPTVAETVPTDGLFRFPAQLFRVLLPAPPVAPPPPVLSHLPVWPSTRRLWPPPRSVPEGRGLGCPWVFA